MNRRQFIATTVGLAVLPSLPVASAATVPVIPQLLIRQRKTALALADGCPIGEFYLKSNKGLVVLGKDVVVEVLRFRERVTIFEKKKGTTFVSYDKNHPLFQVIKAGSRRKGTLRHAYWEGNRCMRWEVESLLKIGNHQAILYHGGIVGMMFVVSNPVGSKIKFKSVMCGPYFVRECQNKLPKKDIIAIANNGLAHFIRERQIGFL